jgi:hypothetical protein
MREACTSGSGGPREGNDPGLPDVLNVAFSLGLRRFGSGARGGLRVRECLGELSGLAPSMLVLEADKSRLPVPPEFKRVGQAGRFLLFEQS